MKVKELKELLNDFRDDDPVYIYNRATGTPLWVPGYNLSSQVDYDEEYAQEYDIPENAVFITGK